MLEGVLLSKRLVIVLSLAPWSTSLVALSADAPSTEEVQISSHGTVIRGTIFLTEKTPAIASVVLVPGAGRQERMRPLGRELAARGITVLTYDKRGVGKSGGIYAGPEVGTNNVSVDNLTLLAQDASAALAQLCPHVRMNSPLCGFIGISQAGWIVPLAARKNRRASFMVLWSGAVETTHEDMRFEHLADASDFWEHHTHNEVASLMQKVPDNLDWADFDPLPVLRELTIPGLWLFGGRDRNVDVDLAIQRLDSLIADGHANYQYRLYPAYDHYLSGMDREVIDPTVEWIVRLKSASRSLAKIAEY
jgi:pimeloyl-ACP methyl ester carboxylesterase